MGNTINFQKLLEPGYFGKVKTRNRIIKTAAGTHYSNRDHMRMSPETLAYYEGLAKGGVGLIIVESPSVHLPEAGPRHRLDDDIYIEGYKGLTTVIHKHGCPAFIQLYHGGPMGGKGAEGLVAATAMTLESETDLHNEMPHELTIEEIEMFIDKFASAAVRAAKAGFDGVEINAGSSHLFHSFISPFWNRRTDIYGGSIENRARFLVQTIREVKKRLGDDFPVGFIINGIEIGMAAGIDNSRMLTPELSLATAKLVQEAGANIVHVRSEWTGAHQVGWLPELRFFPEAPFPTDTFPKEYYWQDRGAGPNRMLAATFKKNLSMAVMTVGKISPELGEMMLKEGMCDFIGMTRPLNADPELPRKIAEGSLSDVRPCTRCNTCTGVADHNVLRRCRINAAMGTPQFEVEKAAQKRNVLVVGGGPAGMEAARVAALRGHNVTLYEKASKLGGLLPLASMVKGLEIEDLPAITRYFAHQFDNLGVKVNLGKEVTTEIVKELKPDAVVVAGGGLPNEMNIPGNKARNVVSSPALHRMLKFYLKFLDPKTLRLLTKLWMPLGKNVVVMGGPLHGVELAEFLVKRGRKVTIVETSETLGEGIPPIIKPYVLQWLRKKGVTMITGATYDGIEGKYLTITTKDGKKQRLVADTFVPALPLKQNTGLVEALKKTGVKVIPIGDCDNPGLIVDAIAAGWKVGNTI
ncbi:MAG TPA: FAD-dependent oxidoreductase [Syntrophorhabdaceae bacterium]|nr:FAD-dependent oxidoreductase [Syntrophorhabdaceae bacterium]